MLINQKVYTVKLKINKDKKKVRKIFLRSKRERTAFVSAIIKAQGYTSQLEQYRIKSELERNDESTIVVARHNALGCKVVIKAIPSELYHAKTTQFSISEVDA